MKKFIAVAGNVGVGKSTLTGKLSEYLCWEPFYEAVDDNPYLADFYKDMCTWSFHSQVYFLSRRLGHHRQIIERPGTVVQDRTVYEDAEIFARNFHLQGHMSERDWASYWDLYQTVITILPPPDLVIYLQASVPVLQERIRQRGRDYEQQIAAGVPDPAQRAVRSLGGGLFPLPCADGPDRRSELCDRELAPGADRQPGAGKAARQRGRRL